MRRNEETFLVSIYDINVHFIGQAPIMSFPVYYTFFILSLLVRKMSNNGDKTTIISTPNDSC